MQISRKGHQKAPGAHSPARPAREPALPFDRQRFERPRGPQAKTTIATPPPPMRAPPSRNPSSPSPPPPRPRPAPAPSRRPGLPLPQRYWAIVVVAFGISVSVIDSAIANVALPTIARYLHASAASSIWVVNAYQLAV